VPGEAAALKKGYARPPRSGLNERKEKRSREIQTESQISLPSDLIKKKKGRGVKIERKREWQGVPSHLG